jgi:hypothetical protein
VTLVFVSGVFFAELGEQAPLIHVEIPNRGRIQAWRANQATKNATNTHSSDIFVLPIGWFDDGEVKKGLSCRVQEWPSQQWPYTGWACTGKFAAAAYSLPCRRL